MNNWHFIAISAVIFFIEYFLSVFWPFLLQADIFIIWVLMIFFLDRPYRLNWPALLGAVIFFDLWSGGPFGGLTLALLLTILIIFLAKKIILTESINKFTALFGLVLFYYFYIFLNAFVGSWTERFIWPEFSWGGFMETVFWTIVMMIVRSFYEKKKISRSRLRR